MPKLELQAAAGIVGLSFIELFKMYKDTAPDLVDVRKAPAGDYTIRQSLLDTNVLVGAMAIAVGSVTSFLSGTWIPVTLMLTGFTLIATYYYLVCRSPSPSEVTG
jgi:hypothetical protein